jgi:uncharacterized protein (TIGR03067 family)
MTDLDKLQGAWSVTSLELDGQRMPAPESAQIVVDGERFQSLGMGAVYEGRVEINAGKKPKQFDLVFTKGPETGNRSLGIYELNGDAWKICMTVTGKTRPSEFATSPGSGCALETLRRGGTAVAVEVDVPAGVGSAANDPAPELEGEWQMTACSGDGYPVPESMVKTGRRVARGGVTESFFGDKRIMKARYTVDRSAEPHTIDYALNGGGAQYGIWRFVGEILEISFALPGKARPADFEAAKGRTVTSWRRVRE